MILVSLELCFQALSDGIIIFFNQSILKILSKSLLYGYFHGKYWLGEHLVAKSLGSFTLINFISKAHQQAEMIPGIARTEAPSQRTAMLL